MTQPTENQSYAQHDEAPPKPKRYFDQDLNDAAVQAGLLVESVRELRGAELGEQDVLDMIEGETTYFEAASAVTHALVLDEAMIEAIKAAQGDLAARRSRYEARVEGQRAALLHGMRTLGLSKMITPAATLAVSTSGGKVNITDESALPADAFKTEVRVDLAGLAKRLKAGEAVPGAELTSAVSSLKILKR